MENKFHLNSLQRSLKVQPPTYSRNQNEQGLCKIKNSNNFNQLFAQSSKNNKAFEDIISKIKLQEYKTMIQSQKFIATRTTNHQS